jgi:predicted ABC-type ATPase
MPKVVVIAGPNGAGKSTTAPRVLRDALQVEEFVNADTIAAGLSAFSPESVALQAGRIMLERIHELSAGGRDFAFETTLASRTFAPWLQELQAGGYIFHLVYLWLPTPEAALARVAERVRRGGHAVQEGTVRRRYERSLDNFFNLYTRFANTWMMMDNSNPRRPRVIARRSLGRTARIVNTQQWGLLRGRYERQASN